MSTETQTGRRSNADLERNQRDREPTRERDRDPRRWLAQASAFTRRSLQEVRNSWLLLGWVIVFPSVMYLFFVAQGTDGPATADAIISIGIGVMGALFVCLYLFGDQLAGDLEDRRYAAYRSMPLSPAADLAGRMAAGLVLATAAFAATILAGVATGAEYGLRGPESIPIIVVAGLLTWVFWMVVAIPIVLAADNESVAEWVSSLVAVAAFVLTGFNGALPAQSPIEGELLNYLPNALPTRLLVYHLVPAENWTELGAAPPAMPTGLEFVALLAGYAIVALVAGTVLLNRYAYDRGWWP
ncbi:ABC transporter permease [Haloterrigena salifodinae]|uniref:ABC transporter permease n=1 Tax=Haloterrigena salifodinae TaxID=2675099 RepID=UPI0020137727|nr:ABC transporter permease [Haloterrigena salifodinae]